MVTVQKKMTAKSRRGAALVELAIVLFLLITIVFGCVDFGRFAFTSIAVANAAREGANVGSMHPVTPITQQLWELKIREAVSNEMSGIPSFDDQKLSIPAPNVQTNSDDVSRVRVEVSYPFEPVVPWLIIPNKLMISRTVEMRVIQ